MTERAPRERLAARSGVMLAAGVPEGEGVRGTATGQIPCPYPFIRCFPTDLPLAWLQRVSFGTRPGAATIADPGRHGRNAVPPVPTFLRDNPRMPSGCPAPVIEM